MLMLIICGITTPGIQVRANHLFSLKRAGQHLNVSSIFLKL